MDFGSKIVEMAPDLMWLTMRSMADMACIIREMARCRALLEIDSATEPKRSEAFVKATALLIAMADDFLKRLEIEIVYLRANGDDAAGRRRGLPDAARQFCERVRLEFRVSS